MNTKTLNATVEKEFPGLTTKEAIAFAKVYLQLAGDERDLFLTIMELTMANPDRIEFARNWKGNMKDLPAALAQI